MSARARVLNTPELLEAILLSVEIRTLLVAGQRVNRFWRDVITTSPGIRQTLFLQPRVPKSGDAAAKEERTPNPLLKEAFKPWFHPPSGPSRFHSHGREVLYDLPLAQPQRNDAFTRAEASWRRMLTHQPPLHDIGFVEEVRNEAGSMFLRSQVSVKDWMKSSSDRQPQSDSDGQPNWLDDGLRMGQLYDFTLQVVRADETVGAMRFRTFWCKLPLTQAGCKSRRMLGILNMGFDPKKFGDDFQLLMFVEAEAADPLLLRHMSKVPASKAKFVPKLRCEDTKEIRFGREGIHNLMLP